MIAPPPTRFGRSVRNLVLAGWPAALVVVSHSTLSAAVGHYRQLDPLFHFAGGAAGAYAVLRGLRLFHAELGALARWNPNLVVLPVMCAAVLGWELIELAGDRVRGTRVQLGPSETIVDMVLGMAGAACALGLAAFVRARRGGSHVSSGSGQTALPKKYNAQDAPVQILELTRYLMPLLLEGDHAALAALREQFARAQVTDVELTGCGFFVEFEVPPDAPLAEPPNLTGGSAKLRVEGLRHGAGCVLFVRDGRLDMLEGFTYGNELWAETAAILSIEGAAPLPTT